MRDLNPPTLARARQRRKVYDLIVAEVEAGRPFPSARVIANHMGWIRDQSARDCLSTLCHLNGLIKKDPISGKYSLP